MKRYIIPFLAVLTMSFTAAYKLQKVKVGNVSLLVPEAFESLDEQSRYKEYSGVNMPIAVYRSQRDRSAYTVYQVSDSVMLKQAKEQRKRGYTMSFDRDINLEYSFKKASISNKFKDINFIQEGVQKINGKDMIVFEFEGIIEGRDKKGRHTLTKVYNYMVHTFVKHNTYSVGFICNADLKDEYLETVHKSFKSLKVK
ncbi:hypothetical protein OAH12_01870 [Cyclobacteriaceae bacterium]|nr:hypothetical protein [Cyclobacteriaceae bacterium]